MTEEPYRWVEAIANRREYIEQELAGGSPIVALSCEEGIVMLALSRERQKIYEIYDRIAMGGIGHPGDIERLRMAAIELCSTEGFARSPHDVSLRRLANYSLSPALKSAFEQVYGPPYLARLLFAELGRGAAPDLFLRLEYDGAIHSSGGPFGAAFERFGVLSGTVESAGKMDAWLRERAGGDSKLPALAEAIGLALDAWCIGHLALSMGEDFDMPEPEALAKLRAENLKSAFIECGLLERGTPMPMTWRALTDAETRNLLSA